jgi:UDP-2,3-diacylglucosamine pyrophosphatase LpxH
MAMMDSPQNGPMLERLAVAVLADCHVEEQDLAALCATLRLICDQHPLQLVLLGDIFERWTDTERRVAKAQQLFSVLQKLKQHGTHIVMIRGNREVIAGRRLEIALGVPLEDFHTITLAKQRIAFLHGEQLFDEVGLRALTIFLRGFWLAPLLHALPGFILDSLTAVVRSFSRERNRRRLPTYRAARLRPRALQDADHLILGHVHRFWHLHGMSKNLTVVAPWTPERPRWFAIYADGHWEEQEFALSLPRLAPE